MHVLLMLCSSTPIHIQIGILCLLRFARLMILPSSACAASRVLHAHSAFHSHLHTTQRHKRKKRRKKHTRLNTVVFVCECVCHGADRIAEEDDPTVFFQFGCCCGCLCSDDAHKRTLSKVSCMAFTCLNQYI